MPSPRCCFYGWIVWAVLCIGQISCFLGASSGVTFIVDPIRDDLGLTQTTVALAYTFGTAASALVQTRVGRLVDKHGGRFGVTAIAAGYALSLCGIALPTEWFGLAVAFGLLRSLGVGALALSCNTCLQQWFDRRRGLATGLSDSVASLMSYAVLAPLLAVAVPRIGWRES